MKAFTESLRMELEKDKAQISLTLTKPAAIDTPFTAHAKNYMEHEPDLPPPIYAPELVAKAILHAAETPERDLFVGGRAKLPRPLDGLMRATPVKTVLVGGALLAARRLMRRPTQRNMWHA